ncbi:hypothetical protein CEXT_435411 [Caerostris extrusa]|uniref:Uncharacterized protein n=1 Tax=Caerostris extrusa TaxID=172846 RepID=A0AAV4SLL2_CAEEX|nr:hypothetical protein CEXT_435411 [Caerostris extrusa]
MINVLPTLEEEEVDNGAGDVHVEEAVKTYTTLIEYTFRGSLKGDEKVKMRDLITNLLTIIQKQSKDICTLLGANQQLEKIIEMKQTYAHVAKMMTTEKQRGDTPRATEVKQKNPQALI